jgi:hypothetical protein
LGYGPVAAFLNTVMILPEPQKQGISWSLEQQSTFQETSSNLELFSSW